MGLCNEKSVTYLRKLGYNVVRHPSADIKPLGLIGRQKGESIHLGPLNLLIVNPPGPLPGTTTDVPAADVNGQESSKLDFAIGVNILGALVSAMGGNLGVSVNYTNAEKVQFNYSGVLSDAVVPLAVGNYLREAPVDAQNLILKEYVLGNGDLYLITKVVKSKRFTATFEKKNGVGAKVDVPMIEGVVGGNIAVSTDAAKSWVVTFEGTTHLVFGFQCFHVAVEDGVLGLTAVKSGGVPLAVGQAGGDEPVLLGGPGMMDLGRF